jgi:hypothetical protein
MHMLRHHHIPEQLKSVPHPLFFEDVHESVPRPLRPEVGSAAVTTEWNKVKIVASVISSQWYSHLRQNPHTLTDQRVRHPPQFRLSLYCYVRQ